ncbi:MAG: phosphohexomutase domain-containing protein, partial [Planctomycetota bacterium]
IVLDDGACAPFSFTDRIEERCRAPEARARRAAPADVGILIDSFHAHDDYVTETVEEVDFRAIGARAFRVLIDPANGAASFAAKDLFESLRCRTDLIHFDPLPAPERPSEPRADTVRSAIQHVKTGRYDLGVCLDIDADRVLFITSEGEPLSEDTVGAIFAIRELKKDDVCVVPVNSSGLIEKACRAAGARLEYCPAGQPATLEAVKELGAVYSYEESGKYYFASKRLWSDGLYTATRLLEIMARERKSLSDLADEFRRYHQVKQTVPVPDERKAAVMDAVQGLLADRLVEGRAHDVTVDGFKRCYGDDSWLLIRASGTEPLIRVYSDAPSKEVAEERAGRGVELVQDAMNP